ncbi:MAG: hypothetical protein IPN89_14340 [Saprospiraceae bacterium]|nr:hypothetical protein [Saprospiraceae bacterium]
MKYSLKLIIFLFILSTVCFHAEAQFQFGGGMKFNSNTDFKAVAVNAKFKKNVSDRFDGNVDVAYYIASKASWSVDLDMHYRLFNINDKVLLNPFAGINFTKTSLINTSLSLGGSVLVPTDKYTYFIEPRWILDFNQFVFSVGILYPTIN